MDVVGGVKQMFSSAPSEPGIPPPSYPEFAPMYGNWDNEDMSGIAGIALDNNSLLIHIQSFLSGQQLVQVKDNNGKVRAEWQQIAEPKLNERGVRAVVLELRARLDKNTILTYIPNEEELRKFMMDFSINMSIFLGRNAEDFEIKDNYLSEISDFIVDMVLITLWRGLQGNEKQGVYKQVKRIEQAAVNMPSNMVQQQSRGIFK